jgi:hypothetical protein
VPNATAVSPGRQQGPAPASRVDQPEASSPNHVIDSGFLSFVRASFRSVWTVELLLFLWRHSSRAWTAAELVREMRASEFVVREGLILLQAAGLVGTDSECAYRYGPALPQLDGFVEQLDALYRERPFSVMQMIFSTPGDKLQTFAEAFKLKKD